MTETDREQLFQRYREFMAQSNPQPNLSLQLALFAVWMDGYEQGMLDMGDRWAEDLAGEDI